MAIPPRRTGSVRKNRTTGSAPGWMVTLADMFMLLLTFFILLLSFSSLDTEKYRAIVMSMSSAFSVAPLEARPDGLAVPDEDAIPLVHDAPIPLEGAPAAPVDEPEVVPDRVRPDRDIHEGVEALAALLIADLEQAVADDTLDISFDQRQVVIRFSEDATFPSGSAELIDDVHPILADIVSVLSRCEGDIVVSGHTDDRPIVSARFRSNWDLSAARAVSVVHELTMNRDIPAERVVAAGRAETQPLADNQTAEGRARNRRVEIGIFEPECDEDLPGFE